MDNLIPGIVTILLSTVVIYFSWKYAARENYRIAVLLLILGGLILRIYTSSDLFLHTWDERYHALVAKNLISHPLTPTLYETPLLPYDYRNWTGNHIWLHKQPLPLWSMAFSMWIFGVNEIALRLPSMILTCFGIYLTFSIGSYFFNRRTGYFAAFLYAINGLIIELTAGRVATDHIDIFFLFFIQLAIFFSIKFAEKQKTILNILAGASIGAAILSKWLPALIVLPVWLLIVIESNKFRLRQMALQFSIFLAVCVAVFLPWQLYIFKSFPAEAGWEASYTLKHMTEVIEGQTGPFYYFIDRLRINYGELIYLPLLWFLWQTFKNIDDKKRLALLIWFLIPLIFYSIAKTKMQAYILFTSPALFIITAEFWHMLVKYPRTNKSKWVISLLIILLIALPVRYSIERVKPFEQTDRNPQWVNDLKRLNDDRIKKGVLFNYSRPIEAMFYTNLTAYSNIPDKDLILDLQNRGYTVIINDDGHYPIEFNSIKGLIFKKLSSDNDN